MMMKDTHCTIVMRSMNDGPKLVCQTLEALDRQKGASFDLLHIDSGSSDGTMELLRDSGGRVYHIRPLEYVPGAVLNFGMELCLDELVVFLNADAVPVGRYWLADLLAPLQNDSRCVASFSRQIPREDAEIWVRRDYDGAFGESGGEQGAGHFFSMASSAIRRSHWEKQRFDESLQYSEDIDWTYRAYLAGAKISYVPESVVVHSHNYRLRQLWKRHRGEGLADAGIYASGRWQRSLLRRVAAPMTMDVLRDLQWAAKSGLLGKSIFSPVRRFTQKLAYWNGLRRGVAADNLSGCISPPDISAPSEGLYTIERKPDFESRLNADFERIGDVLKKTGHPPAALVLGGGYGRREGGVIDHGDLPNPYNDYDLYAVYDLPTPHVGRKIRDEVFEASEKLGEELGIDVDISPVSLAKLKAAKPRIEWYELKRGHLVLFGDGNILRAMPDFRGVDIPMDEGERLLMNRAVGMLLARRKLISNEGRKASLPDEDIDFITRNIFKALLAAGDVVLLRMGLYHYSYRERKKRLGAVRNDGIPRFEAIRSAHGRAMDFRLNPSFSDKTHIKLSAFWETARIILEEAHRWFVSATLRASDWEAYAGALSREPGWSPRSILHAVRSIKSIGKFPADIRELRSYRIHLQRRVRAAIPFLLYRLNAGGEVVRDVNWTDLADILLLRTFGNDEKTWSGKDRETIENKLISLWKESN